MVVLRSMLRVCFPYECCAWPAVSCMCRRYGDVQSPTFLVRNPLLHCAAATRSSHGFYSRTQCCTRCGVRSKRRRISSSRWRRTRSSRTCSRSKTGARTIAAKPTMRMCKTVTPSACSLAAVLYRRSCVPAPVSPTKRAHQPRVLTDPSSLQYQPQSQVYCAAVLYGAC